MVAHDDTLETIATLPPRVPATGGRRLRRALVAVAVAGLAAAGCAQDTTEGEVAPENQDPLPAQQPEGGDDPTLSGEDTGGVGEGQSGGQGSGSPDSGDQDGTAGGDSPTAGEDG